MSRTRPLGREQAMLRVTWIGLAVIHMSAGTFRPVSGDTARPWCTSAIHSVSDFATDAGGAALPCAFQAKFLRTTTTRPREIRNARPREPIIGAAARQNKLLERSAAIRRNLRARSSDTAALVVSAVSTSAPRRSALSLHGAACAEGRRPLGRGRRMASPQRHASASGRALVGIGCAAIFLGGGWPLADPAAIVVALLIPCAWRGS